MGFSKDPGYQIQNKIYTGYAGTSTTHTDTLQTGTMASFLVVNFSTNVNAFGNFLDQYAYYKPMPSDIDEFVSALIASVNANGGPGNTPLIPALNTSTSGAPFIQIKAELINEVKLTMMLESPNPDGTVMSSVVSSGVFTDIYEQAFNDFLREFQYKGTTFEGTPEGATVNQLYYADRFNEFFFQLASVANSTPLLGQPGNTSTGTNLLNFEQIFTAYFGGNPTAFEAFLANYINTLVYPASGNKGTSFIPSQDVGAWLSEVQKAYMISLRGSAAPLISSVGASTRKVDVLENIYVLLIKMIGVLQKVAAAQSDRLKLLTEWTGAYTNLQTQVPIFTSGDGTIFGGKYGNNTDATNVAITSRDDANSLNQTFTETIRSRRTQIDNAAKSLQNNLNQSNDTANQQADAATTIIQNLRTLLSAIYK